MAPTADHDLAAPLSDQPVRDRIRLDTGATLFVDAGAGSGKTKSLVDRVSTLVLSSGVSLRHIAAVTFTEKAGAELRDRLRAEFERVLRASREDLTGERAAVALDDLDAAAIGTLHSFAQRILTMHPIEAHLPPLIEVLDEVGSSVAFDNRWAVMQRNLLDDAALAPAVRVALATDVKLVHLRSLARALQSDWDLIQDHILAGDDGVEIVLPDLVDMVAEAKALAARADECSSDNDLFLGRLAGLGVWATDFADATEPERVLTALTSAEKLPFAHGQKGNWAGRLEDIRESCLSWRSRAADARKDVVNASLRPLTRWIAREVQASALDRAAEGKLEFHDLLVLARDLLRGSPDVRTSLQTQFPYLLLDEFQDTDPIQIEIAVRIAGGAAADARDWREVAVPPGSLFVVGDPKQSIYRFRRADIRMYLDAQRRIGETVSLDSNFRTVPAVLAWVNEVFASVITQDGMDQPAYAPLSPTRPVVDGGPSVILLGGEPHSDNPNAAAMREREAAEVAAVIEQALGEGWTTYDERDSSRRKLRLGDIAILVPARTSLPFLEDALDEAGIPYRAESSSLVYQASEVRDLLAATRAVADPSDLLACVTALRSPLFACGDDDLWTWKRDRGSFSILAPLPPERASHPVARSLSYLRSVYERSRWLSPSEVLGLIISDRRMLEVAAVGPRSRDQWRRLRFVVDQARAWSETEHGGLRAYLAWAARQGEETARVAEAVLPETDVDAVRVMTVHAAKGLEFPMVVLSGMSSRPQSPRGVQVLWTPDGYEVRLTKYVQTNDFENVAPVDEQMDNLERRRLLYVATTRARDHLVVSLHRKGSGSTNAEILADAGAATTSGPVRFAFSPGTRVPLAATAATQAESASYADWLSMIERAQDSARRVSAISASGLEGTDPSVVLPAETAEATADERTPPGAAKGARDVELPPWSKGRYGSAIGRAVHAVLQAVDLSTGAGLEAAVAAQCIAEGVGDHAMVVQALAQAALDSDLIRRAAAREHWRETYVGRVDDAGDVVEGFVDLVFRDDDGSLVVVDYKTDAIPAAAIGPRTAYYAPQVNAYERALHSATEADVSSRLLFLNPEGAVESSPASR